MSNAGPGWYPDPNVPRGGLRYWNGSDWTNDFAPSPQVPIKRRMVGATKAALALAIIGFGVGLVGYLMPFVVPHARSMGLSVLWVGVAIEIVAVIAAIFGLRRARARAGASTAAATVIICVAGVALFMVAGYVAVFPFVFPA